MDDLHDGGIEAPLYIRIADELAGRIASGQLAVGERVPSVRTLAQQKRLSPTTALAALRHLEQRGDIEARPQSGYYVRQRPQALPAPDMSRTARRPRYVAVNELFARLIHASARADIVPLGSAVPEHDWYPAQTLQRALSAAVRRRPQWMTEYGHYFGVDALRHEIARMYAGMGCSIDPDEVLITNGCMEALNLALRAIAAPGDVIAVESPTFFGFLQIIENLGMKAVEIATDPHEGISLDALRGVLERDGTPVRALLLSPTVGNPLGTTMPEARQRELLALCARHQVEIIEDDVYGDLHFGSARPPPLKALDTQGIVTLCASFSKTLAPGMRIGWILGGARTDALRLDKFVSSVATPAMLQQSVADFLQQRAYLRHLSGLRRACRQQIDRFSDAVERHFPAGTRLSRPQGGFVLWLELPPPCDSLALHDRALEHGISFAPGPLFSSSGQYRNALRLNCGRELSHTVEAALRTLGGLAKHMI
ncbi:PLP-dependent aminotransferase family protein [Solimonas marina]|uniref:PLP-dependent aminotransferase family protein n=1 Tax=Solimonas marina TaxID=2714601 RepID=A0A970B383_9GAMM|nr:PLP-dependent aminotransferase family protein [Solimonas marina]NKF20962.1 PLP-dependent aminotransferase family protein [Solimonas marina]